MLSGFGLWYICDWSRKRLGYSTCHPSLLPLLLLYSFSPSIWSSSGKKAASGTMKSSLGEHFVLVDGVAVCAVDLRSWTDLRQWWLGWFEYFDDTIDGEFFFLLSALVLKFGNYTKPWVILHVNEIMKQRIKRTCFYWLLSNFIHQWPYYGWVVGYDVINGLRPL